MPALSLSQKAEEAKKAQTKACPTAFAERPPFQIAHLHAEGFESSMGYRDAVPRYLRNLRLLN